MKKFIFCRHTTLVLVTLTLFACKNTSDRTMYSAAIAGNTKNEKLSVNDLKFLKEAYSLGLFKIDLANEARIRSTSAESVQLARGITVFNAEINSRIEKLAKNQHIILPMDLTDQQKVIWKQLVKEKGWNFDKKFAELVEKSEVVEKALYNNASQTTNKNIKQLTQKIQPELQLHESLIQTLIEKINEKNIVAVPLKDKSISSK